MVILYQCRAAQVHAEKAETGSKYAKRKIGKFNNFYKEMGIVAHMQEMQPYFDKYQEKVRKAKNASGMTLAELSQCSGVPYNSICSVNAGTTKQPLLFYSAATCKVLGLSLDELMGLRAPEVPAGEQQQQIYELISENNVLHAAADHYKALGNIYKPLIFGLLGVCALLLCAVIGYIIFDIRMTQVGLFQSAGMSVLAVLLAVVVIAAIALMAYTAKMIIKNAKRK
jgi:hypothetical protein